MRCHQTPTSPRPTASLGCRRWICDHAPANARTGESRRPMPSATTSGTGEMASVLIRSAPASATAGMTSMPSTQRTVAVDFATVSDMARTRTTAQKRPSPIESTTRSQSVATRLSSKAASGPIRRCSGDTYRIPGPHEPREVVAGTYDVEVDVLAEVEARVLVRPAEAGHVDVEHDQARSPSAHGLHQPHPVRAGARRDHRDGAPGKAADPVPGEGLRQRRAAVRPAAGEVVADQGG